MLVSKGEKKKLADNEYEAEISVNKDLNINAKILPKIIEPTGLDSVLAERRITHGNYTTNAKASVAMQQVLEEYAAYRNMNAEAKYAIQMILGKIARTVNGDWQH